jgi:hypothetical protein
MTPTTGTFQLSLSTPQQSMASCLTQNNQQPAWSCNLSGPPAAAISVGVSSDSSSLGAFIFYASNEQSICYGTQSSFMETSFAPFITVQDNEDPSKGPAYYFSQFYDKLVVVPENALTATSKNKDKRQIQLDSWLQRKQVAQAGDKPWFCLWNNTFLEGFIYVEQTVSSSYTATATPSASLNASTSGASGAMTMTPPSSTDMLTTTITEPFATVTFAGPSTQFPGWFADQQRHEAQASSAAAAAAQGNSDNDKHNKEKRRSSNSANYSNLSLYPYMVKLEERRLPGNTVSPYCQQYQILDDGGYNWVADANGNPIIVQLQEDDPDYSAYQSAGIAGSKKLKRDVNGCHCQWTSGQF